MLLLKTCISPVLDIRPRALLGFQSPTKPSRLLMVALRRQLKARDVGRLAFNGFGLMDFRTVGCQPKQIGACAAAPRL